MKIPLSFRWSYLQGDRTEYQQRSVELEPMDLFVVVELDATPTYFSHLEIIKYWEKIKVAELTGGNTPKETPSPIFLTLEGVKEARRLVNEALRDEYPENHQEETSSDWDEDEETEDW